VHFDARTEEVALELVAAGLGVAFVSSLPAATEWPGVVLRDLGARAPVRRVVAIARPEAFRPPAVAAMVELVREGSRRWQRSGSDRAASS
jgi:DNA-binding transcriptional LysR family regulator